MSLPTIPLPPPSRRRFHHLMMRCNHSPPPCARRYGWRLRVIFGPGSDDLIFSGDPIDDRLTLNRFVQAYDQKHKIIPNNDGSMTIIVGNDDWPMPIPIVKDDSGKLWVFDTNDGKDEVIARRIGRNELTVIQVCKAIGDAQREYASDPNGDSVPEYARKFISDPGKNNGLYWPTPEGETPSPLGAAAGPKCRAMDTPPFNPPMVRRAPITAISIAS